MGDMLPSGAKSMQNINPYVIAQALPSALFDRQCKMHAIMNKPPENELLLLSTSDYKLFIRHLICKNSGSTIVAGFLSQIFSLFGEKCMLVSNFVRCVGLILRQIECTMTQFRDSFNSYTPS